MSPDHLDIHRPELTRWLDPESVPVRIAAGFAFTEGPVWYQDGLAFSDIPNHRIARLDLRPEGPEITTLSIGACNGLTVGRNGRLLVAEHDGRRISEVAVDGSRKPLVEQYQGGRLNSPNDIVTAQDGTVYFTDPPYAVQPDYSVTERSGWWSGPLPGKEQSCNGVYRLNPDDSLELVIKDMALPNGLALSPDDSTLYVADSAYNHLRAFDLKQNGQVIDRGVFLEFPSNDPGIADGLKVDLSGNLFVTGPGGLWVSQPDGIILGRLILPEQPANLAWGDDGSVLYLTARTSVYRLPTRTSGILPGTFAG